MTAMKLILLTVLLVSSGCFADNLQISSSERTVDLTTHLTRLTSKLEVENLSGGQMSNVHFVVPKSLEDSLSYISASETDSDQELTVDSGKATEHGRKFTIKLRSKLEANKKARITVNEVYHSIQEPYPKTIKQSDTQLVTANFNVYLFSPYKVVSQTTNFKLFNSKVVSYTKLDQSTQSDKELEYGPFDNVPAFSALPATIHFENNSPFLRVNNLLRWIEISHWGGNIAVEERIEIKHAGAKLEGPFSRFDYMYLRSTDNIPSVKSYKTVLPAGAKDVYYRDEIGNISTSNMLELLDSVELEIRPRYPLFGGWQTHYTLGYNLPSFQYLFHSGSQFGLNMRFVDHIFDNMFIDEMTVKIILPEGAGNIDVKAPYEVTRDKDDLHYTYLDITGRPVVTLTKKNVVEEHIQDFELRYTFNSIYLLREPLMLISGLLALFLAVIIFVRLDFSISIDSSSEAKMRVSGVIEQVLSLQRKRESLYRRLEQAVINFRQNKDSDAFQVTRKAIEAELNTVKASVDQLIKSIKDDSADSAEKLSEIQRQENAYLPILSEDVVNATKVVGGSISFESFKRANDNCEQKKSDHRAKIAKLLSQM